MSDSIKRLIWIVLAAWLMAGAMTEPAAAAGPAGEQVAGVSNVVTLREMAGVATQNYPLQIARPFLQGEIQNYPQAVVDGSPVQTQADVKQRYGDGSVKHAVLTFFIPQLAANAVVSITFQNQAAGLNAQRLTAAEMLDARFDFDAGMELTAGSTITASARQMLQDGNFTYWLEGPVATSIILADHSATRRYDIGFDANRSFRPIYHATFWPAVNKVRVRFIGEIANTEALQDQGYALQLFLGEQNRQSVYSKGTFTHTASSRWTKEYWLGGEPPKIAIDHNLAYLKETRFFPNYDTSKVIPEAELSSRYASWQAKSKELYEAGWWLKGMYGTGGRPDIGPYPTWAVQWLYTGDVRMAEIAFKQADLAAAWTMHSREGDPAKYLDRASSIPALGKVLSLNARPTVRAGGWSGAWYTRAEDKVSPVGPVTNGGWDWDWAHQPDAFSPQYTLSGDFWYLEEMYFWASFSAAAVVPETRGPDAAHYYFAPLHSGLQVRGEAWAFRNRVHTAFLAPDGHPEKAYFNQLIDDAIAFWEGTRNITTTSYYNNLMWQFGRAYAQRNYAGFGGLSPLHLWDSSLTGPQYQWTNSNYKPTYVQLVAKADDGSVFSHWEGDCADFGSLSGQTGSGCVPEIDANRQITAVFQPASALLTHTLTVNPVTSGSIRTLRQGVDNKEMGLVQVTGIACGSDCSESYNEGTTVVLEASPASGFMFTGWSGGGCSGTGYCRVKMVSAQTVSAAFGPLPSGQPPLTIKLGGYGRGVVTSQPPGLNCGTTCISNFTSHSVVTLTATPEAGSHFERWDGITGYTCTGSANPVCSLRLDYALWLKPIFRLNQPATATLSVARGGAGSGSITSHPYYHINCGTECQTTFTTTELTEGETSNWMENFLLFAFGRGEELGYPTTPIKKWLGQNKVDMLTHPDFSPYLIATYRTPAIQRATGRWFADWASTKAAFHPTLKDYGDHDVSYQQHYEMYNADAEHGYSYIAMAGVSYATDVPNGPAAWQFMIQASLNRPELTSNPKWAITPRQAGPVEPRLSLHGVAANRAIYLTWGVSGALPATSTWRLAYYGQAAPVTLTNILSPTRAYTLTDLTNGVWYTVTLNAMAGSTPILTDSVKLMPAGQYVYLPLALKEK